MAKRAALGRGLGALIPEMSETLEEDGQRVFELDISEIDPNPYQPRMEFDAEGLDELARSIQEKGIIQPITVRRFGQGYQLITGERRLRASRQIGYKTIPALVIEVSSPEEMMEISLVENIQREDLNPIDEAKAYRMLIDQCFLTQEEVSKKVGKDRSTITNMLRLLRLSGEVQDYLRDDQIAMGHARALLSLDDEKEQIEMSRKIIQEGLPVRKVEQLVKARVTGRRALPPRARTQDPLITSYEEALQMLFGTAVRILRRKKRGKIEIEFYGDEDLERILEIIKGEG